MSERARGSPQCGRIVSRVETSCFAVSERDYRPHEEMPRHRPERASLCMVLGGGFEERTDTSAVRCEPATLLYHPAGVTHAFVISEHGSRCLNVDIAPRVMSSLERVPGAIDGLRTSRVSVAHWFAYKLRAELRAPDDLTPLVIDGVALALLGEFVRQPGVRVHRAPAWIERVREYLHDEFAAKLSLSALAKSAGVHRVHVARGFREHYGCTVGEYTRQRRVEFACHRLTASNAPLSEIALEAGFADQSHFTTTFRRLVGIAPGEFRLRVRQSRNER